MSIIQEELLAKNEQVQLLDVSCEIEIEYDESKPFTSKTNDKRSICSSIMQSNKTGPSDCDQSKSQCNYIRFDDEGNPLDSSESDSLKTIRKKVDTIEEGMMMIVEDKHKNTRLMHANNVKNKSLNKSQAQNTGLLYEEEPVPLAIKEEVIDLKEENIDLGLNEDLWNESGRLNHRPTVDSIACVQFNDTCVSKPNTFHLGPNDRYVTITNMASSDSVEPMTVLVRNADSDKPICETLKVPSRRNLPTKLMVKIDKLGKTNKTRPNKSRFAPSVELVKKSQSVVIPAPTSLFPRIGLCLKDTIPLHCVLCTMECSNRKALIEHVKSHSTDKKSFECPTCKKTFTQQCNLKRHMRCHSGERPYSCLYCKKLFADQGYLTTHLRYHTNTKPYTCEHCDKSFFDRSNYVKHLKSHSGEKPYPCPICKKSFLQQSDLTRHKRVHSGERPFGCSYCDRSFTQHGDLTNHLRHHTGERPFVCSDCQKTFANKRYLNSHVRGRICFKKK